jgi:hypothetical protein
MNELKISQGDAKTPTEFDALLRAHHGIRQLAISLEDGVFHTTPTREWSDSNIIEENPGWRFGPEWTLDGRGKATLMVDQSSIPDDRIDPTPLAAIRSTELRFDQARLNQHTPEEMWEWLPRGQAVRNLKIDVGFREALPRWRERRTMLRLSAIALAGHQAAIENVHVVNYGAYLYEGFPLYIQGAYGMYDRNLIALTDPETHIFDAGLQDNQCSHITDCLTEDIAVQSDIGDQVSVHFIGGSAGERTPGEWTHHYRAYCYQTGNRTIGAGSNTVQGYTVYNSLRALVARNKSKGAAIGYYGDFYKTKGVVIRENEFGTEEVPCEHGVMLMLSPTATGMGNAADYFSHEDYDIGPNKIISRGAQVRIDTLGPPTANRYIKGIKVDASLTLENHGGEVTRTGVEVQQRGGCRSKIGL